MTGRVRSLAPLAIVLIVAACNQIAWNPERAGTAAFALWAMAPTVLLAGLGSLWLRREDGDWTWLAPRWGDPSLAIAVAMALFGAAWLLTHVLAPLGTPRAAWAAHLYLQLGPSGPLKEQMPLVVLALAAIAFGEEVLWRGVVVRLCEPLLGSRRAWIASAFLYAAAHLPTTWQLGDATAGPNPLLMLGALGAGLVWGALARWRGRLFPGIVSHLVFDWTVLVLFRLSGASL